MPTSTSGRPIPLRLTAFLRATEERGVPVLLLHNYPYHRQAAYLAQVFSHVYVDVGLAVHNTGALSRPVIAESLEVVPFGKLLFSTDAYGLAELYYLGTLLFRRGLSAVLTALVDADEMTAADAERSAPWWPGTTPAGSTGSDGPGCSRAAGAAKAPAASQWCRPCPQRAAAAAGWLRG